jgi:hypothetical protein
MISEAAFAIDDTSALGRRARTLLAGAGLAKPRHGEGGPRALLVDPEIAELTRMHWTGLRRLVLVSQALPLPGDHGTAAAPLVGPAVQGAIRAHNQPYLESLLPRLSLSLVTGRFLSAAPAARLAYVAHEDAAIVAAALLASDFQDANPLRVTGPAAFSHRELCGLAGELFSRRVVVEEIGLHQLDSELRRRGLSEEQAALAARADALLLHAHDGSASTDAPRVTGVAALSLRAFLDRAREGLQAGVRARRAPVELWRSGSACAPVNAP